MTVAELTAYTLTHDEAAAARTAFNWAIRSRYMEMQAALRSLPYEALRDIELALGILLPTVRVEIADRQSLTPQEHKATCVDGNDRPDAESEVE